MSTTYTFPSLTIAAGTLNVSMTIDGGDEWPVSTYIPDNSIFLNIGKIVERMDVTPGFMEIESLELDIAESYITIEKTDGLAVTSLDLTGIGYWWWVLMSNSGTVTFLFTLTVGSDTFYLFRGTLDRRQTYWKEYYVGSTHIRGFTTRLVSMLDLLRGVSVTDLLTEAKTHYKSQTYLSDDYHLVTLRDIIASMVELTFPNADYDRTDVIERGNDFKCNETTGTDSMFSPIEYGVEAEKDVTGSYVDWGFWDDGNDYAFENHYSNAYELLGGICAAFGYSPRYFYGSADGTYDGATDRHRIELLSRGASLAESSISGSLIESDAEAEEPLYGFSIVVRSRRDADDDSWYYNGQYGQGALPAGAQPEIDITVDFHSDLVEYPEANLYPGEYSTHYAMDQYYAWDHSTSTWMDYTSTDLTGANAFATALRDYYIGRFRAARRSYTRLYSGLVYMLDEYAYELIGNNGFETDTSGWANVSGSTITRITGDKYAGSACLEVAADYEKGANATDLSIVEGVTYRVTFWAKHTTGGGDVAVSLTHLASLVYGPYDYTFTDGWVQYTFDFTATATQTCSLRFDNSEVGSETFLLDEVYCTPLTSADGDRLARVLSSTVINDGVENKTYYASEIEKDVVGNTTRIRWTEV